MSLFVVALWSILLCDISVLSGQDSVDWVSPPIQYKTRLTGSFAEPRSNHFHAGIDYKKNRGVPLDTIFSIASGRVSRISVQPDGYGNVLYIDHPTGYTSVYAHLHHFSPKIQRFIENKMIERRRHKINYTLRSDTIQVRRGEYIGIMGNTGRSSGPHLHFEIRRTANQEPVNPAILGLKPKDTQRPTIKGIALYGLTADQEIVDKKYYPVQSVANGHYQLRVPQLHTESLLVGLGVHCYDTMDGAPNHNGIYGMLITQGRDTIYHFELDQFSFETDKYIHAHMDYGAKLNNRYISLGFKKEINPLTIYNNHSLNGVIITSDLVPQKYQIKIYDYEGNSAYVDVTIKGIKPLPNQKYYSAASRHECSYRLTPQSEFWIENPPFEIKWPGKAVYRPAYIWFDVDSTSRELTIGAEEKTPIFEYIKLKYIAAEKDPKLCFIKKSDNGKIYTYGGKWENEHSFVTFTNSLGVYQVARDETPPSIQVISLPQGNNRRIAFRISDNYTPKYSNEDLDFELLVDNKWLLCQWDGKSGRIWHDWQSPQHDDTHQLQLRVKDAVGNVAEIQRSFTY